MITKIEVDGFKSLKEFELNLNKGLNILVGPNGSGKTNIILFFEFLSNITRFQVGNAISNVGGAGTIFQKIGKDDYVKEIVSKIYGSFQIDSKKSFVYEYSFTINISFEKDNVYFSNQNLKLRTASKFWDNPDSSNYRENWDLDLSFQGKEDSKPELKIIKYDKNKIKSRFIHQEDKSAKDYEENLRQFILSQNPTFNSIVKCLLPLIDNSQSIYVDLVGGETFNVVPSKVREIEDSATPPGIKKDGSGLATTLYAMKKSKTKQNEGGPRFWLYFEEPQREFSPVTLDKIIKFLRAANSTIKALDVENDPFNKENNIFIIAEISNYEPYKYQQISVNYKLYYDNNIQPSSIDFDFEKEYLREFYLYALSTYDSVFKENFNNKEYNCKIIKNDVLRFKENYHTYIHNKIKVSYDEIIASQENQTLKKSINTILPVVSERIKVKNFQTNYKFPHEIKSFGDYKLDVIIPDKSEYKKGKIFEVVVQLYGDGFLEDNVIPNLYIHEAFETVSNTLKNERTLENGKIKTVAIRTYKLKAVYEGKYTFYPASFYFYNEITNEKKAIYSKEFTIQVK